YTPVDTGRDTATLRVTTSSNGAYSAALTAEGTATGARTDSFNGMPAPKMDVLLIVDDSGSMSPYQSSLSAAFPSFTSYADGQNIDYRIAVTTTSICPNYPTCSGTYEQNFASGRFVPLGTGTRVITPSTPNRAAVFDQNVKVGTNGHWDERLLRPFWLALQPPLVNGHNAGFLRSDAQLSVVIVSDAEDADTVPVTTYVDFLRNLKAGSPNGFTLHGIIPTQTTPPSGCYYDGGRAYRVEDAIRRTGGFTEEICTANWSTAMGRLGRAAFGPRTRYFLTTPADASAGFTVTVDGQPVSSTTSAGTKRWTYDPATNAIDFELIEAPKQTSTLQISYTARCTP
ncbi:MAG: hypothetical protein ACK4N5_12050, partial [Myxococcales bacterium]